VKIEFDESENIPSPLKIEDFGGKAYKEIQA
jgi:hypothetical protein